MKLLLIAISIASIFAACKSNTKTDKEMVGTGSAGGVIDSSQLRPMPKGTKRVTVVETHNGNGSSTVTTTTDINATTGSTGKTNSVPSQQKVSPQPTVSSVPGATTEAKKKRWSSRAKGAAIGGVGGAAAGAIISKNKVAGAVLGGAIGAGGGYIIGNEIDRNKAKP